MSNPFIGRREKVGLGIETTPGTVVAPQGWQKQMSVTLDPKTTVAQDSSGMGVVEDISDSAVTEQWAEGKLDGLVTDLMIGYPLANIFGVVAAALHSSETTVYDNTFTTAETTLPPSLTIARVNPVRSRRFGLGMLSDFEVDIKQNDFIGFTGSISTKAGSSSSETVAFAVENKFTSKHAHLKFAANLAGLGAATEAQIKSMKLKITRKNERFTPIGAIDPVSFDPNAWSVTGSIVARYTDTTLEDIALLNTSQAMSLSIINTDVTIGTSANPSLVFTAPQVRLDPQTLDNNLDKTLSQTFNFTCEFNSTAAYMLKAVLTNMQNGYAHA